MSSIRSAGLAVLAAGTLTAALASPALAASASANADPSHRLTQAIESHENHAPHGTLEHSGTVNASVTSTNWSGYAATGSSGAYTSVTSSWTEPTVTCGSATTYSSFWVGLDGYSNSALEQTGTEADCVDGQAVYGAWWEVLPEDSTSYDDTVAGGDALSATVTYTGSDFTMTLTDSTQGWTETTTHAGSSGFENSSAEVVAEAPEVDGSVAALSDFGTAKFTGSQANGSNLSTYSPTEIVMTNDSGSAVRAQPSSISGGTFSVAWKSS